MLNFEAMQCIATVLFMYCAEPVETRRNTFIQEKHLVSLEDINYKFVNTRKVEELSGYGKYVDNRAIMKGCKIQTSIGGVYYSEFPCKQVVK